MQRLSRRTALGCLTAVAAFALPGTIQSRAQGSTPAASRPSATPGTPSARVVLPHAVILPLSAVRKVVPEMVKETATGANTTAVGDPAGTRSVTLASADGARRVVLSLDQYRSVADATVAFQEAVAKSQAVPGAKIEAASNLGEAALIGVVTQGNETHVGGGARFGDLIVTVTLQGYAGTDANKATVIALIRAQAVYAKQALPSGATPRD